jgi:hypothetical protein
MPVDHVLLIKTIEEDGIGTVLRFLALGAATRTITAQTPLLQLQQAWQTDAVERNEEQLLFEGSSGFQFTLHPHEIVTVRVVGKCVLQPPAN